MKSSNLRACLSVLFVLLCAVRPAWAQEAAPAQEFPGLSLTDAGGQTRSLAELRGRVVVLNFWATWCVPCREEMPVLVSLRAAYAARGVEVVGASADDESTRPKVAPFAREMKLNFPVWLGATTEDMQRFGLGTALPATAVLDRDGRVRFRIRGPVTAAELRERVEWLLGERQTPAPAAVVDNIKPHEHEHAGEAAGRKGEDQHADEGEHGHEGEEEHEHGGVGVEGASTVPS